MHVKETQNVLRVNYQNNHEPNADLLKVHPQNRPINSFNNLIAPS